MRSVRARIKTSPPVRGAAFLAQNALQAARAVPRTDPDRAPPEIDGHDLIAMIRVRNEARFLPEWLAHHLTLGIEHVVIYDNNSTDGTAPVVAPFVERGLVTVVPWPTIPASPSSHLDFFTRFGASTEWAAFFDADEFLVETRPGDLRRVLADAAEAPAVAVNWRYHGSAGHESIPRGLVTQRFDRADPGLDHHIKVIARPDQIAAYRNSHNFYYRGGRLARTTTGRRVFGSFSPPRGTPRLVLNHYVYRSREDYLRKAGLGFVDASGAKDQARRADLAEREFDRHNDAVSGVAAERLAATAALLADLGYSEEVGATAPAAAATDRHRGHVPPS
jgi:Glycosyl transferase family 2